MSRLKEVMEMRGVRKADIVKATGIPKSTLTEWYAGKYQPKSDKRRLVAEYLGVSLDYLDGVSDNAPIELFEAACGEGRINSEPEEYQYTKGAYFYVKAVGDSMLPEIRNGDVLKALKTSETSKNDFSIVKINGDEVTVKFVEISDSGVTLTALNEEVYQPHVFSVQEVLTLPLQIIGKVVEIRRTL